MGTECRRRVYEFPRLKGHRVEAAFEGGCITSDGGALLLQRIERRFEILQRFASCFTDYRDADLIEHTVEELVSQRVYGLALGYEDLNDHDELRRDPLLAAVVGKEDPTGADRKRERDTGKALAGKSTLNRLELTDPGSAQEARYKKIAADGEAVDRLLVDLFIAMQQPHPKRIVLDLDATDDPVHGNQEGRFFHGYYREYCYLPLYIFCGDFLLCARLRQADRDGASGTLEELSRIVPQIREAWGEVELVIRADSGFCREEIMAWCEQEGVDYILGLAQNGRLKEELASELARAEEEYQSTGQASRVYKDFNYQTLKSWSHQRRVIGKAEHLEKGANPRFVVTSIQAEKINAQTLYEREYCARGEMENRIKEQQHYLFADRTSAHVMRANQLRLYFSCLAYVLLNALRHFGLEGTEMARAQCHTIREKLLRIGALVRVSVRRVVVSLATGYPYEQIFAVVYDNLRGLCPLRC